MKFAYKTQEELDAERPKLAEGDANFEIVKAEDAISKSGNEMIKLSVQVWDANGMSSILFDYLVSSVAFKIKQLCESIDKPEWYAKDFDLQSHMLIGQSGSCVLKLEKNSDPQYEPRIKISAYYKKDGTQAPVKEKITTDDFFNDDLPF